MISFNQKKILAFPYTTYDAIICDGAVRSGKTTIMTVAFIDWAMKNYNNQWFGICGKTVDSARKNIINPYLNSAYARGKYTLTYKAQQKILVVKFQNTINYFEVFGGANEASQALIQGRTFAGVFVDEVTLQPQSFVEQAIARCSVAGARLWFNCNPSTPSHWFYTEWIQKADAKNALYIHLTMKDNPGLSEKTLQDYEDRFSGVFYDRFVLGRWVTAYGLIYPNYRRYICEDRGNTDAAEYDCFYISVDYGILNPTAMLLIGKSGDVWYILNEYYYNGRETGGHKTDEEYYAALKELAGGLPISGIIVDPSAASFISVIEHGREFRVWDARNDVLAGLQHTTQALENGRLFVCESCTNTIQEFGLYSWDANSQGADRPIKKDDHAMDAMRYFVETVGIYENGKKRAVPWLI